MKKVKNNMGKYPLRLGSILIVVVFLISCQTSSDHESNDAADTSKQNMEISNTKSDSSALSKLPKEFIESYNNAKTAYLKNPNDPDALIWYGRRTAYLGQYQQAIDTYSIGINKHPEDARMYRHRGHRYISTRQYNKAIADFEKAITFIKDQEDEVEQDGLPNEKNIPLSTLHGNIWYHLGLTYYLKNDMENALSAFSNRTVTEKYDDNIVSGKYWQYMILRRLGRMEEATAALDDINLNMDIIENRSYYKMCLFFKGLISPEELKPKDPNSSSDNVFNYALGNWNLFHQKDTTLAKQYYQDLLENGNQYSFAYLAAEADRDRLSKIEN